MTVLVTGTKGTDVGLLHGHLVTVGYEIDSAELHNQVYGPSTQEAVMDFQARRGLGKSGAYDRPTADDMKCAICKGWRR